MCADYRASQGAEAAPSGFVTSRAVFIVNPADVILSHSASDRMVKARQQDRHGRRVRQFDIVWDGAMVAPTA